MAMLQRIGALDLTVGAALDFDVYSPEGTLLLRRGQKVATDGMVGELLRRGASRLGVQEEDPNKHLFRRNTSLPAFESLEKMVVTLQDVLMLNPDPRHMRDSVLSLAEAIVEVCVQDEDAALAAVALGTRKAHGIKHHIDTAIVAEVLSKSMGLGKDVRLAIIGASLTMNLSMLALHDRLNQRTGGLTDDERQVLFKHPDCSMELLKGCKVQDPLWLDSVRYHHESVDGSGYMKMAGNDIPIPAQVVRLSDIYTARVTHRSWADTEKSNQTLLEVLKGLGKIVRADLGTQLVRVLGIFPPGNHVLLENGEIGVVLRRGKDAKSPVVASYIGASGLPLGCPLQRDTSIEQFKCVAIVDPPRSDVQLSPKALWGFRDKLDSASSSRGL